MGDLLLILAAFRAVAIGTNPLGMLEAHRAEQKLGQILLGLFAAGMGECVHDFKKRVGDEVSSFAAEGDVVIEVEVVEPRAHIFAVATERRDASGEELERLDIAIRAALVLS
jgi:hypothetical protein